MKRSMCYPDHGLMVDTQRLTQEGIMKTKNCGSCAGFFKWKNNGGGLCEVLDARTKSDNGHNCELWKAKKYERPERLRIKDLTFDKKSYIM